MDHTRDGTVFLSRIVNHCKRHAAFAADDDDDRAVSSSHPDASIWAKKSFLSGEHQPLYTYQRTFPGTQTDAVLDATQVDALFCLWLTAHIH